MIPELAWIFGSYAAVTALAHWAVRRSGGGRRRRYVLVAGNHERQIEWYIRALRFWSRRTGTEVAITVLLDRSDDETGKIAERLARGDSAVTVWRREEREAAAAREFGCREFGNWERLRDEDARTDDVPDAAAGWPYQPPGPVLAEAGVAPPPEPQAAGSAEDFGGGSPAGAGRAVRANALADEDGAGEPVVWLELSRAEDVARLPL